MNSFLTPLLSCFELSRSSRELLYPALILVILSNLNAPNYCLTQEPQKLQATATTIQFESPQELAKYWMKAVNRQNWRDEYRCYSGTQQAQFTYNIFRSINEFSDTKDMSDQCDLILRQFNFPSQILGRFASLRTDLSGITNPQEMNAILERLRLSRKEQLQRWEREVQPLNLDWDGMIEQLQPLFIANYSRHSQDLHPSSTGIVHHLGYHRFELPSINRITEADAEGTVVAIIRDPNIETELDTNAQTSNQSISLTNRIQSFVQDAGFRGRQVKRKPAKLLFTKIDGAWRISTAPYR
jgi:hypothetical protein